MSSSKQKEVKHEKLEIPSKAAFERRFLVDDSQRAGKPEIAAPTPPSSLLSRLQNFLPALQDANQQLENVAPEKVHMEQASDDEGAYVELDLACGLFDLKNQAAVAAAERSLVNSGVVVERFGGDSSSGDDSSDDECSGLAGGPNTDAVVGLGVEGCQVNQAMQHAQQDMQGGLSPRDQQQGRLQAQQQPAHGAERAKQRKQAKQKKRRARIEVLS